MTALQHPRVRRWLGNFDGADRPTAELLVGSLAFIGAEDVRAGLIALVQRLLLSLKGPTAVFPARETSPVRPPTAEDATATTSCSTTPAPQVARPWWPTSSPRRAVYRNSSSG